MIDEHRELTRRVLHIVNCAADYCPGTYSEIKTTVDLQLLMDLKGAIERLSAEFDGLKADHLKTCDQLGHSLAREQHP